MYLYASVEFSPILKKLPVDYCTKDETVLKAGGYFWDLFEKKSQKYGDLNLSCDT